MVGYLQRRIARRLREEVIRMQRDISRLKGPEWTETRYLLYLLRMELEGIDMQTNKGKP